MSRRPHRSGTSSQAPVEKSKVQYPERTVSINLESPVNAVSTSKDGSRVVVAGRNIFKVVKVTSTELVVEDNLRVGKVNLNFSHTDVQWSPTDDHTLATGATNGAVVLWDLSRNSKNKLAHVFNDHKRTVNKVCFNKDGSTLFSGSQDGTIKSFDVRVSKGEGGALQTFDCKTESVRDIQVNPNSGTQFAAALENGCVQIWDTRYPAQYEFYIAAHQGPVFTCDWHLEERHLLATAGRDKIIKVWDMRDRNVYGAPQEVHALHTIASVARIKWRPEHRHELASCSLLLDFNIHVWDIRRPYIPFASFQEHKDSATGIVWQREGNSLLSSAKDSCLYLHHFDDALRPAESAPPLGLALSCRGHVTFAISDEIKRATSNKTPKPPPPPQKLSYTQPAFFRHVKTSQKSAPSVASDLKTYLRRLPPTPDDVSDLDWMDVFQVMARGYKLEGLPMNQLVEHNQEVARRCGRQQEAQAWLILNQLYTSTETGSAMAPSAIGASSENALHSSSRLATPSPDSSSAVGGNLGAAIGGAGASFEDATPSEGMQFAPQSLSSQSDAEETHSEVSGPLPIVTDLDELNAIASGDYLNEENADLEFGFADCTKGEDALRNLELPSEAFQPRYDLEDPGSPSYLSDTDDVSKDTNDLLAVARFNTSRAAPSTTPTLSVGNEIFNTMPAWNFSPVIRSMLEFYAHQGNVQMTVSVLLVLGEKGKSLVETDVQEQWYLAYVDLLSRFQLWSVSAQIVKLCPLKAVNNLNLDSTTVPTQCGVCCKVVMEKGSSYCDRCHRIASVCSICHQAVRGLYVWCQGCGHGGHIDHLREWFRSCDWCPRACGHKCEFM